VVDTADHIVSAVFRIAIISANQRRFIALCLHTFLRGTPKMLSKEKILEAQLSMVLMLLVISVVFHLRYCVVAAIVLIVLCALSSWFARAISNLWTEFFKGVQFVVSKIVLAIMFYLIVTPIAVLFRIFHKNHLALRDNSSTLWKDTQKDVTKESLSDPW
jgi:predicted membrane protein